MGAIERELAEDALRPIIFYTRTATCGLRDGRIGRVIPASCTNSTRSRGTEGLNPVPSTNTEAGLCGGLDLPDAR